MGVATSIASSRVMRRRMRILLPGSIPCARSAKIVRMKRTNVVLDENVLEKARELSGERTYSATINRALDDMVRKLNGWRFFERFLDGPDPFYPGYAEELYGAEWVRNVRKKLAKK